MKRFQPQKHAVIQNLSKYKILFIVVCANIYQKRYLAPVRAFKSDQIRVFAKNISKLRQDEAFFHFFQHFSGSFS